MLDNTEKLKSIDDKIKQLKIAIKQLDNERYNIIRNANKSFVEIKAGDYVKISTSDSLSIIQVDKVEMTGLIRNIHGYTMTQKSDSLQTIKNGCYIHPIDRDFSDVTINKITKDEFITISSDMLSDANNQRDRLLRINK